MWIPKEEILQRLYRLIKWAKLSFKPAKSKRGEERSKSRVWETILTKASKMGQPSNMASCPKLVYDVPITSVEAMKRKISDQ